jgi:hypothetical protein
MSGSQKCCYAGYLHAEMPSERLLRLRDQTDPIGIRPWDRGYRTTGLSAQFAGDLNEIPGALDHVTEVARGRLQPRLGADRRHPGPAHGGALTVPQGSRARKMCSPIPMGHPSRRSEAPGPTTSTNRPPGTVVMPGSMRRSPKPSSDEPRRPRTPMA